MPPKATEKPAQDLLPIVFTLFCEEDLTSLQYRIWYLKYFTPLSLYAITQQLGAEGFQSVWKRPLGLSSVKKDLGRARRIIDLAVLKAAEEQGGKIFLSIVVAHGHKTRFVEDRTLQKAHDHLGLGIRLWEPGATPKETA